MTNPEVITVLAAFLALFSAAIVLIGLTAVVSSLIDRTQTIFMDEHDETHQD